jgi:hypothetical protein
LDFGLCRSGHEPMPHMSPRQVVPVRGLLLFWVVGESESELPVDLGAVGGIGFGEGCGDVAELLDERVDLFRVMVLVGCGWGVVSCSWILRRWLWTSVIYPVTTVGSAPASRAAR